MALLRFIVIIFLLLLSLLLLLLLVFLKAVLIQSSAKPLTLDLRRMKGYVPLFIDVNF